MQLDLVLVALRNEKEEIDSDRFTELLASTPKFEKPVDAPMQPTGHSHS